MKQEILENVKTYIETANGIASYVCTEIEDENELWNDDYNVRDGYYIIHKGNQHHVYKLDQVFNRPLTALFT